MLGQLVSSSMCICSAAEQGRQAHCKILFPTFFCVQPCCMCPEAVHCTEADSYLMIQAASRSLVRQPPSNGLAKSDGNSELRRKVTVIPHSPLHRPQVTSGKAAIWAVHSVAVPLPPYWQLYTNRTRLTSTLIVSLGNRGAGCTR